MKLRWSNGTNYAEGFEANDLESFQENGLAALRVFRAATYRSVHRGETGEDELWFDIPQLHARIDGRWLNPGLIKETRDGVRFFEPGQPRLAISAPTLEDVHIADRRTLTLFGDAVWEGVCDLYEWSGAIDAAIMMAVDEVERAAVTLGRKGGQSTSQAKAEAARRNGRKGGRPKKNRD